MRKKMTESSGIKKIKQADKQIKRMKIKKKKKKTVPESRNDGPR